MTGHNPATEILRMIEEVSPDDTAKLDEIDARVQPYVDAALGVYETEMGYQPRKYTRSRDALKAIRPGAWYWFANSSPGSNNIFSIHKETSGPSGWYEPCFSSQILPTEELAELHAIIQAIEHDRSQP